MINTTINKIIAYTTREFRNFGLYFPNQLYMFKFTKEDNMLLSTGAIKLLPYSMCNVFVNKPVVLNGKKYEANEEVNCADFEEKTLMVLLKTGVIKLELKEDFKELSEEEVVSLAKVYECIGKTFKKASEQLGLDFDMVKEKFELKQGSNAKKVTSEDVSKFNELILGV